MMYCRLHSIYRLNIETSNSCEIDVEFTVEYSEHGDISEFAFSTLLLADTFESYLVHIIPSVTLVLKYHFPHWLKHYFQCCVLFPE